VGIESGVSGSLESLGAFYGGLVTGDSPAAVKSREFIAALLDKIVTTPSLKAQFVEALTALKNTSDDVWKDTKPMERLAASAALKTFIKVLDT